MTDKLTNALDRLRLHPIFHDIQSLDDLRVFMEYHVFCVFDFMSLLKSVQNGFCHSRVPWLPPKHGLLARMINQIVVDEETDLGPDNEPISHYELYLKGMSEVGADTSQVLGFTEALGRGVRPGQALDQLDIDPAIRAFVECTLDICEAPIYVRAGCFFHSREAIIPDMFRTLVNQLHASGQDCDTMIFYLDRHIKVDEEEHGPMAREILKSLYRGYPERQKEVELVSLRAIEQRINIWDACLSKIRQNKLALSSQLGKVSEKRA